MCIAVCEVAAPFRRPNLGFTLTLTLSLTLSLTLPLTLGGRALPAAAVRAHLRRLRQVRVHPNP